MRIVLIGPPGSGKGTQGSELAKALGVPEISSGELLRDRIATGSGVWSDVRAMVERAELVPDDLIVSMVRDAAEAADAEQGGYILDGFPRTRAQAEHSDAPRVDAVVYLDVPDDDVRERIAQRADEGRADDADPEVIDRRLRRYHAETTPVLDLYRELGVLKTIDGSKPPDDVAAQVRSALSLPA